ncbi:hypothetical protein HYDPIDRAFT_102916 [Hydnomerulius pinastri MD-312]|uniref:polynucleotide adenylyltransferase n=1 Tax=Hydnomerulius pinastri MD-312 TaxID=994086 RepID=A0A0C9UZ76_9AGAM|nr:hypothetical protein HYDPIDRAFT_102916 [Hydnomerulius pinastri MD-312]
METLSSKPSSSSRQQSSSSRRDRDRHRDKKKSREKDKDSHRSRDRDHDRDRDRNRNRYEHARKEPVRSDDLEPGEAEVKLPEIGDDFIPFTLSDDEAPPAERHRRPEKSRQKEKAPGREWDRGKPTSKQDRDEDNRRAKRKYDLVFDEDDDWAHSRRRRYEPQTSRKAPWVSYVNWDSCHNVAEMLHREVEAFVKYMSPSPIEDEIRGLVVELVTKAITSAFPDARILPFGSYETKLYLPSGDIDLVIDSDSMAYSNKVNVLHALANTLKRARITSKVTVIARAKVPIVKFVTNFGRLNVDISVNQGNGVVAGKIVNGFLQDMRGCGFALRCLVIIAKAFLNQRGMNEVYTGGLGSYSIVCLAVSFLQMHPKIRRGEIEPEKNLGVLVMEFFEFYGCYFNYEEVGISVRHGGTYYSKRQRGWYDSVKNHLLSIEDPTDPSNDISKGSYGIAKVRQTLAGAHGIMQATAFMRTGILSSRREGRSHQLRKDTNPEDMSILSSILGVTQETINNRLLLQEVYDQRSLHQLLGISPKASVITAKVPANHRTNEKSVAGANSVREAWNEGNMELGSDDEDHFDLHVHGDMENGEDPEVEEAGRYHIERRSSQGRSNGTSRFDPHTVFTTDDEEEKELSADEVEHRAYEIASDDEERKGRMDRRRSYWLSKGIEPGQHGDDEDSESS